MLYSKRKCRFWDGDLSSLPLSLSLLFLLSPSATVSCDNLSRSNKFFSLMLAADHRAESLACITWTIPGPTLSTDSTPPPPPPPVYGEESLSRRSRAARRDGGGIVAGKEDLPAAVEEGPSTPTFSLSTHRSFTSACEALPNRRGTCRDSRPHLTPRRNLE